MPAPFLHGNPPPESLADHVTDLANAFENAALVLSQQYTNLNKATNGLLDGTYPWQGQGATSFSDTWQTFGHYMQSLQKACEDASTSLTRFANKLNEVEAEQAWNFLLMVVGGLLTIISFAAAIAEFGLNPFVDGFTALIGGFTEQEGSEVVNVAENITQADTQAASDLQAVEEELTTVPTLSGTTPGISANIPDALSPVNIDEMTLTITGNNEAQSEFFQFDLSNGEPGSTTDEVGQQYLNELKQEGVIIDDSAETQQYLKMRGARGVTWNDNLSTDPNPGPQGVTVLLGSNANNATVYEEYLHYQELKANNWVGPSPGSAEYYMEEIKVERQVLANATMLKMTPAEQAELQQVLQGYINDLYNEYGIKM